MTDPTVFVVGSDHIDRDRLSGILRSTGMRVESMAMTGHRSVQTVIAYTRGSAIARTAAARFPDA